jgi:hypothetical protein
LNIKKCALCPINKIVNKEMAYIIKFQA